MERIAAMIREIEVLPGTRIRLEKYSRGTLVLVLPNGRKQTISILLEGNAYVFASTVVGAARAKELCDDPEFLPVRVWSRNRQTDLVNFTFDREGRLIGRASNVAQDLQPDELMFILGRLADECDRFELVLTGEDRF